MRAGDLVRMKRVMFWHLKSNPYIDYTDKPFLVLSREENTIIRLMDTRTKRIFRALIESYDVISSVRE